jgi:hypothetical protein
MLADAVIHRPHLVARSIARLAWGERLAAN